MKSKIHASKWKAYAMKHQKEPRIAVVFEKKH